MKRKKSFDWYGARQRFSIRTYHFGAASVLLGLTLATGAQAVQAEELVADTTVTTSIQSPATTDTTPALTTETAKPVERTATIDYVVNYVLEDGTLVNAGVKTATVTTTEAVASTSVEVAVEVPAGYELAQGQATTVTQVVTEGAENLVTVQLVKKAEEVAPTTEAATEAPATITEAATETPATTTEVAAPVTAEEAKVVLEQNISEAVVLSDEANRLYTAAPEGNESLKTAADATKLSATEATTVLKDSVATLDQVNDQIDAVRTNVEALALELRKRDEDGVLTAVLAATATSPLGTGTGVQLVSGTTVGPSMDDANGATVTHAKSGSLQPTATAGYHTFKFIPFSGWYDGTVGVERGFGGSSTNGSYMRASVAQDGSEAILVEWVDKDGNLLESHMVNPTESVDFTHFQAQALNTPVVVSYTTQSASELVLGTLHVTYKGNTVQTNSFIPKVISNTTSYVTTDGTVLATYSMATMPGLTTTPSDKRTFSGYEFVETKTDTVALAVPEGAAYVEQVRNGYPLNWYNGGPYIQYKTIVRPVDNGKAVIKEVWIADPNYQGTHDYLSTTEEGFVRIFTTSKMGIGETNTNFMLDPGLIGKYPLTTNAGGTTTTVTQVSQLNLNDIKSKNQWFYVQFRHHTKELAKIQIQPTTIGQTNAIDIHYSRELAPGEGAVTTGITLPITLRYTGTTYTETTHVYRPLPQRALIIYKTDQDVQLGDIDEENGNPGESIDYSTTARINAYKLAGYELVSDGGPQSGQDATFDFTNDDATDPSQKFYVILKERVVDIPNGAVPGQPVDPNDPNSPVWPAGVDNLTLTEEVTRTITYVDEAGKEVATTFTDKVTFTRTAKVNLVTGEITYSDWTADKADNVLDGNKLPEVQGYTATTATKDGKDVTPDSTTEYAQVTAETADIVEKVVYVQDTQTAKITISTVDANGQNKTEFATVTETGKATEPIATKTTEDVLLELKALGYDVEVKVTDTFLDSAKTFDNVKDAADQPSQSYEIVVKPRIVDIPKDVVPGQPVDPTDPNSPVWPAGVDNLTLTEEVTRTITYVNEAGEEVATTFTDKVTFTRTAQVNLVTGEITYGAWTADNADSVLDGNVLPEVPGYTATTATKDGADVTPASTTVYAQVTADSADIVEKVVYVQDTQTAKITISTVDANGENKTEYATVSETGKHTEPVATTTVEEKLLELKRKGYDVETKVTDTFLDSAKTFDNVKDTADQPSQSYEIVVKERVVDIPKDVVPGQPVDPNDPNSPVWPDSVKDLVTSEQVTRTIKYVYEDGSEAFATVTETKDFTRTASINLVTGKITYGEWTPAQTFEDVPSPLLDGYIADIKVVSTDPVNAEDADIETVVTYKKLGSWVPKLPEGETPVPPITYPNDPNEDPTIPGQPTPTPGIPEIPGYVPVGPDGNELPKDPNTGQYIPPVPVDPTVDTPITYVKQEQQATITFVNVTDPANPVTLVTIPLDGVTGDQFGYDTDPVVANYQKAGYTVTNKNNYSKDGVYSADPADHDVFVFELVQRVEVVDPNDPNTPTPKPGEPVDPTDPNSPKWPETVKDLVTTEEVTRIISYVDNKGNTVFESVTETKKFTRTADINLVTGVITYGEWTPAQTLAEVPSPKKENHLVSLPVVGAQEVTAVDPDINVTVVYTPLGSWVPVVPPGYPEVPETVYPVDPTDPTKPGTDVPTIPYIPGVVPVGPDGETPLKPIDPTDPTKGYEVPPVPEDPSQNTPITYVLADQKATVNYVDEAGNPILSPVELTGKSGADLGYSTLPTIEVLKKKGYELVSNDYPEGGSFDKDALVDQVYTVVLKERVVPVDPTDPNTPTPKPGEPVDPNDPNSPVWPDSVKDLVTKEEVTRTITYVDNTGKTVFETVTETKEFTRTAEINLVTGVITYGEWTPVQTFEDVTSPLLANHLVDTPVVKGQDVN
ncbi:TPA: YSIRK-type signal peptide-containing protein, partial [Streptococcus suis]